MRGSERGACTIARPLSRPKASLPDRRTMKLRLLFWMRGNGRAGSRPSGLSTGSTSARKYCSSQARVAASQPVAGSSSIPARASSGISTSLRQAYCSCTRCIARWCTAASCSSIARPSGPAAVEPSSLSCFRPETRISKNSSRLLLEMHRKRSRSSSGVRASSACASTRWLNSSAEVSRLMKSCGFIGSPAPTPAPTAGSRPRPPGSAPWTAPAPSCTAPSAAGSRRAASDRSAAPRAAARLPDCGTGR